MMVESGLDGALAAKAPCRLVVDEGFGPEAPRVEHIVH